MDDKDCEFCSNFTPKYGSFSAGTCGLKRVFVMRTDSCDRWVPANKVSDVQVTIGATRVEDPKDIVSRGVVADFGQ